MREDGLRHPADVGKPKLSEDCHEYHDAYASLSACRTWNQVGPEPIPNTEIESEMRMRGVDDPFEILKFKRLMKRLDRAEMEYHSAKLEARKK